MTANVWRGTRAVLIGLVPGKSGGGDGAGDRDHPADRRDQPAGPASEGEESDDGQIEFRFLTGRLRWAIDHAPEIVIAVTILLFASAELWPGGVDGVSSLLVDYRLVGPLASFSTVTFVALAIGWSAFLLGIFVYARLIGPGDLLVAIVAYGVVGGLVAGTAASIVLVLTSESPANLPPNVVFTSGYLLMLLVTGWYVGRSMEYTERLMGRLQRKIHDPADGSGHTDRLSSSTPRSSGDAIDGYGSSTGEPPSTYEQFIEELEGSLQEGLGRLQLAHVFAVLVVLPPAYVWWVGSGPQILGGPTSSPTAFLVYAANLAFDFVIAVVAFKFLVFIKYLHELTSESYPPGSDDKLRLLYDLRHPDDCAGLYDLGDFAMRVNLLLLVGGAYLVYRLYVQGLRALPPEVLVDLTVEGLPYNWIVGYVGPVIIFTAVVGAWLYYSFWQLHQKMVRDRRRLLESWPEPEQNDQRHIRPNEPALEEIREAPVWPIDNKQLIPLVVANAIPALVVLVEGFG